ncbi:MAG: hypothetical protein GF353_04370 [Candidatus Lokiarchaeota archaeon]|nr:hypothetical protein [Candidatus Lokiarchaeota archaeon]
MVSNYFTLDDIKSKLENLTKSLELNIDNKSTAIVSEYGGRLLGLFPKKDKINLLWVNPNVREVIQLGEWNVGGDRYWISPERYYFYENPESWEGWFCPKTLDPANYQILGYSNKSCTLSSKISIKNMSTKILYNGEVTRQLTAIKEPINTGIAHCAVEYVDDCVIYAPKIKLNGWSLTNVISGGKGNPGTVLVPTKSAAKPLSYFRTIPKERICVEEDYLAFKIDVDDIYKLAVRPEDIEFSRKAKIGYVLKIPKSEEYGFLVKLSEDVPESQNHCFDVARDHPDSEIGVIQSYNSESPNRPQLNFGEIEIQLKQFETIDNTSHGKAKHQLVGYIGSKEEIYTVIEKYLGIVDPTLY